MTFYGEKFEDKGQETIWDELKYWLENPVTESERLEREKELKAYTDMLLEKAFGD